METPRLLVHPPFPYRSGQSSHLAFYYWHMPLIHIVSEKEEKSRDYEICEYLVQMNKKYQAR